MSSAKSLTPKKELTVVWWPITRPTPYARNARLAPAAAISKVAASIAEFGWRQPLVVDEDGVIIAGHTRLLAAQQLDLAEVPVHVAAGLSANQVKALRLMDNRSHEETSWDDDLLGLELADLKEFEFDLSLTGFDEDELASWLSEKTVGLVDADEVPEAPAEPQTKLGDLYRLGNHRLLCGDATDPAQVQRLMAGERAALMATDPPYLVNYDGGNHPQTWANGGKAAGAAKDAGTKHWDAYIDHASAVTFYAEFLAAALTEALSERPTIYQWFGMMKVDIVFEAWRAQGLLPHQVVIWHKSSPVLGRCDFMWDYEPCLYGWRQGQRPDSAERPPANARSVWEIASREGIEAHLGSVHPTMKPVETMRRPLSYHTKPGDLIYEPFSGSGTALIAAEEMGRRCYALELSPAFCDVAVTRWQNFTGKTAILEADHGTPTH